MSNTPASKVRRPTSVGSVRWVGERASLQGWVQGWVGPGLGEVRWVRWVRWGQPTSRRLRPPRTPPAAVIPDRQRGLGWSGRRCRVRMGLRGLRIARVAGGVVGRVGMGRGGVSEGCRSLFWNDNTTCLISCVKRGCGGVDGQKGADGVDSLALSHSLSFTARLPRPFTTLPRRGGFDPSVLPGRERGRSIRMRSDSVTRQAMT